MTANTVTLYFDNSDPQNPGWAYRQRIDGREIDNGPLDVDDVALEQQGDDAPRQAWYEQCVGYGQVPSVKWHREIDGVWVGEWDD